MLSSQKNQCERKKIVFLTFRLRLHDRRSLPDLADINKHKSSNIVKQFSSENADSENARRYVQTNSGQTLQPQTKLRQVVISSKWLSEGLKYVVAIG